MKLHKKGMWVFEQLGKMLIVIFLLFILMIIIFMFRNKMMEIIDVIKEIF